MCIRDRAIERAFQHFGNPYDIDFDFLSDESLVCSGLVYKSYQAPASEGRSLGLSLSRVAGRTTMPVNEFLRVYGTARGRVAFFNAMREIYLEDSHGERGFWDRLPRLSPPSLFLFGDRDWLVPPGFARFVSQAVPSARCTILGDCDHVPQFEIPERTHALIRGIFAGDG